MFHKKVQPERRRASTELRAPIYSYYSRRSAVPEADGRQLHRPKVPAEAASKAMRYSLRRFGFVTVALALAVSLISILSLSTNPRILPLDPDRRSFLHSQQDYQQAAHTLLSRSLFNRSKLTINTGALGTQLLKQFPDIAVVTVKLPLIDRRPIFYLRPAEPVLLIHTVHGHSYIVDSTGKAIASSSTKPSADTAGLPLLSDESGAPISVGSQALPTSTVAFAQAAKFQLEQKSLHISTLTLSGDGNELDAYLYGQSYYVKFNLASGTAKEQVGTYLAVRHYLQEQGTVPASYIDVRLEGRAYYK